MLRILIYDRPQVNKWATCFQTKKNTINTFSEADAEPLKKKTREEDGLVFCGF